MIFFVGLYFVFIFIGMVWDIMLCVLDILVNVFVIVVEDMCIICKLMEIYGVVLNGCKVIVYYDYLDDVVV